MNHQCPECGSDALYQSREMRSYLSDGVDILPGLGRLFSDATFSVVLCRNCGNMRLFASSDARKNVTRSSDWKPL